MQQILSRTNICFIREKRNSLKIIVKLSFFFLAWKLPPWHLRFSLLVLLRGESTFLSFMRQLFAVFLLVYVFLRQIAEGKSACANVFQHHVCCERLPNVFPIELPVFTLLCFRSRFFAWAFLPVVDRWCVTQNRVRRPGLLYEWGRAVLLRFRCIVSPFQTSCFVALGLDGKSKT